MTHGEIEKKAFEVFPKPNRCDYPNDDEYGNAIIVRSIQREGYIKALGEIESLPKVKGCVARDRFGRLSISLDNEKLERDRETWMGGEWLHNDKAFPEITWKDEPVEVELLIRKV